MNVLVKAFQIFMGAMLAITVAHAFAADKAVANSRYVIQEDTVYDKKTNLTWQRCSLGQRWLKDNGCAGAVKVFTFNEGQQQGGGEWRLPTKDELMTLINQKRVDNEQKPTIDEVAFPNMDKDKLVYWAQSPDVSYSWYVNFNDGSAGNYYNDLPVGSALAIRLVRDGQ